MSFHVFSTIKVKKSKEKPSTALPSTDIFSHYFNLRYYRYGEHKLFVCSLDPSVMDVTRMEMWHNVAALFILGCGAILILICLVKYGLRQWTDLGEDNPDTSEPLEIIRVGAGGKGDRRHFEQIQVHQRHRELAEDCGDHCRCCHECPNQIDDRRRRNLKRMSNIESRIMKKKSRDSQEMTP